MMLVASLFVSGSYDRIAGYAPGSQVTDHNAVDLDQKVMEDYLKARDFAKAKDVYEQGGNSKSYAALTVPPIRKGIQKGAAMTATDQSGAAVSGKVMGLGIDLYGGSADSHLRARSASPHSRGAPSALR